jgi:hypothetical protein
MREHLLTELNTENSTLHRTVPYGSMLHYLKVEIARLLLGYGMGCALSSGCTVGSLIIHRNLRCTVIIRDTTHERHEDSTFVLTMEGILQTEIRDEGCSVR